MEKKSNIELGYKQVSYLITNKNINLFRFMENRRNIRESGVRSIHSALIRGKNFDSPIVVNKLDGGYRIIDGNHRIEAIKRFFDYKKAYANKGIQVNLAVYDNLDEDKERLIYSKWNAGTAESMDDRLSLYKDKLTFWSLLQKEDFPIGVHIYKAKKGAKFRNLLNSLVIIKSNKSEFTPTILKKDDLISFADNLLYDDYIELKKYIIFFESVFGIFEHDNIYCKATLFMPLTHIYYNNKDKVGQTNLANRFKSIRGRTQIMNYASLSGREAQVQVRKLMIDYMNVGRSKHLVV